MKYKILRRRPPEKERKEEIIIQNDFLWKCQKCKIIYGRNEKILKNNKSEHYCRIHHKVRVYKADLDYWEKEYDLEKVKSN